MNTKHPTIAALMAVVVLGLSGCGSSDGDPSADQGSTPTQSTTQPTTSPSPSAPPTMSDDGMGDMVMIDIKDFMYHGTMSVAPGQMVMVTNEDSDAHTLTSDQPDTFAITVQAGATAMFDAPSKPGSYAYHCDFHANMQGFLVVS